MVNEFESLEAMIWPMNDRADTTTKVSNVEALIRNYWYNKSLKYLESYFDFKILKKKLLRNNIFIFTFF